MEHWFEGHWFLSQELLAFLVDRENALTHAKVSSTYGLFLVDSHSVNQILYAL